MKMKIDDLTQEKLDKIWKSYNEIAFPGYVFRINIPRLEDFKNYLTSVYGCEGYRLGIRGFMHTKLKMVLENDGTLRFWIYENTKEDELTKEQRSIIENLKTWANAL